MAASAHRVQGAGRLIQDKEGGISGQGPGQFPAVAVARALKFAPPSATMASYPPGRRTMSSWMHASVAARGPSLPGSWIRLPEGQVFANSAGKKPHDFLVHHRH